MECWLHGNPTRILSLWTLLIGSFSIAGLRHGTLAAKAESLDAVRVSAVSGGEAILPCDATTPQPPDSLLLVVWYKDDVPIYSFDGRARSPSAHWADDMLAGRARWLSSPPSSLRIRDVVPTDRALYRCRVDFKVSPTRNHKIILDVVELPEKPQIFDEKDREVTGIAGPYEESVSFKLTCVVRGGKPMPRLRWWRDDKVIATLAPPEDGSRLSILELKISKLTRDYLEATYTCTADNTPLVAPLRVNVQIEMYLRPMSVEILKREQPLSVGQETELSCRSFGARPPAVITWWLDGKQLTTSASQNSIDGNETISVLRWTPRMEHDRHVLTCRASHATLVRSTIEATLLLNLHYVPIVNLQLGSKMNPNDIEEGDDVYFDCTVQANPPAYKVVWEHNDQPMMHNQKAGVIAASTNLAIRGVSREQAGKYVCIASNVEGDGRSLPVTLQVIYKPVCIHNNPIIIGAAMNEPVKVACEVDAYPSPKTYQWTLNNSAGAHDFPQEKHIMDEKGRSVLTFVASSGSEYGSLSCKSTNLAGQQIEPCRYTLLPAVRPDPPTNCSAQNLTDDSIELRCTAGYDGGLHATYTVEVWSSGLLMANRSSSSPAWTIKSLGAGRVLKLLFYAHNSRGRSDAASLKLKTLSLEKSLRTIEEYENGGWDLSWALGTLAGTVGTLLVVACLAVLLRKRQQRFMQYQAPSQTVKGFKATIEHNNTNHSPILPDDKNPDVVPLGKAYNSAREAERQPEPPPYGSLVSPPVGVSRSSHSIHDVRANTPHTPNTPALDAQSIGTLAEDRRSIVSGTLSRRHREVVTTRTPLLSNTKESCV